MSKAQALRPAAKQGRTFNQLSSSEKMSFVGKVCVFVITFGFAFPTLFMD